MRLTGEYLEPIVLETGLKQGSVPSPTLFNMFLGAIVHAARKKYQSRVPLVANAFQDLLRVSHGRGRQLGTRIVDILYADDMELVATSEDLQTMAFTSFRRLLGN